MGRFFTPTVLLLAKDNALVDKELFAPVLKVIPINNLDEAIGIINEQEYGLAASIFSKRHRDIMRFVHQVQAGLVNVNSTTGGSEAHVPFGGNRLSGNGFRLGNPQEALRAFTEIKSIKWYPD